MQSAADAYLDRHDGESSSPEGDAARHLIGAMSDRTARVETADALYRLLPDLDGSLAAMFVEGSTVSFALAAFDRSDRRILEEPKSRQLVLMTAGLTAGVGVNGSVLIGGQFEVESSVTSGARTIVRLVQRSVPRA